jgi:hypothetical protein
MYERDYEEEMANLLARISKQLKDFDGFVDYDLTDEIDLLLEDRKFER